MVGTAAATVAVLVSTAPSLMSSASALTDDIGPGNTICRAHSDSSQSFVEIRLGGAFEFESACGLFETLLEGKRYEFTFYQSCEPTDDDDPDDYFYAGVAHYCTVSDSRGAIGIQSKDVTSDRPPCIKDGTLTYFEVLDGCRYYHDNRG